MSSVREPTGILSTIDIDPISTALASATPSEGMFRAVEQIAAQRIGIEMAAAFDDREKMAKASVRSIVNVPIVAREQCVGVLNCAIGADRVKPAEVTLARLLAIASIAVFATP